MTDKFLQKYSLTKEEILRDLEIVVESREVSNLARKEVFLGKASFAITGDGKELPQVALARYFRNGDVRSGYYRDQTLMIALGSLSSQNLFSQIYAHSNLEAEPVTGGRLMSGHYGTPFLDKEGDWLSMKDLKNSTTDISPTAGQMPRLLGLAYASKIYRNVTQLQTEDNKFSRNGNEIAWGTIGNASTAEGLFFETINAAGVLQVPMVMSVWDDEFGISVPNELQMVKGDISEILSGFQREGNGKGYEIFRVKGWDYPNLIKTYAEAEKVAREEHVPVLIHVTELTQPFGHSTTGSHERYKTKERLAWEVENDCVKKFSDWIEEEGVATSDEVEQAIVNGKLNAKNGKNEAWKLYQGELKSDRQKTIELLDNLATVSTQKSKLSQLRDQLANEMYLLKKHISQSIKLALRYTLGENKTPERKRVIEWNNELRETTHEHFSGSLYNTHKDSALNVPSVPAEFSEGSEVTDGFKVLNNQIIFIK